jgi:ectoine hydrolase
MIVGMWLDDLGFDLSETFHVTAHGAECLSSFPRELAVKD